MIKGISSKSFAFTSAEVSPPTDFTGANPKAPEAKTSSLARTGSPSSPRATPETAGPTFGAGNCSDTFTGKAASPVPVINGRTA